MELSPTQIKIIETKGNLIVRASAGTGKTSTMVNKIAKEIKDNHTHKCIAAITFTIKAANEIKDRLTIDVAEHFIGTNNSFAIEEVIKPFMKDVYGSEFDLDISTDYGEKINSFEQGINKIKNDKIICSYDENKKNFVFELAYYIVQNSQACQLYLKAKYFKIYIDEYQDCDKTMHEFFMYLCDELGLEMFIVGDEKQSIYIWRGAYPEAFKSIGDKQNFTQIPMIDNYRSCKQIQNYSNLLFYETSNLYSSIDNLDNIILISTNQCMWCKKVSEHIDLTKKIALLRYKNKLAQLNAEELSSFKLNFVYIPQIPIVSITTDTAWLYVAIAKYIILEKYSEYDFIAEIPFNDNENNKILKTLRRMLNNIKNNIRIKKKFSEYIYEIAKYLGYSTRNEDIEKLYNTVICECFHKAFKIDEYQYIATTIHSSKGLEFDQVIIFSEDYNLENDIYKHYVAVTRAKSKLIIVDIKENNNNFKAKLEDILLKYNLSIKDLLIQNN